MLMVDQPRPEGGTWIGIDDYSAARAIAGEPVAVGHCRIGIVSFALNGAPDGSVVTLGALPPATLEVTSRRLDGYRDALAAVGPPGGRRERPTSSANLGRDR